MSRPVLHCLPHVLGELWRLWDHQVPVFCLAVQVADAGGPEGVSVPGPFGPGKSPYGNASAVEKAHTLHIAEPCCRDEGPWVDGPALVKQVLEAAELLGPHWSLIVNYSPMSGGLEAIPRCIEEGLAWAAVVDQHLEAGKITLSNGNVEHGVCLIPRCAVTEMAVLQYEGEAVGMPCTANKREPLNPR